jgi:hypothetical protein
VAVVAVDILVMRSTVQRVDWVEVVKEFLITTTTTRRSQATQCINQDSLDN